MTSYALSFMLTRFPLHRLFQHSYTQYASVTELHCGLLTQYSLSSPSYLWNPGIIAGNQTNKETKTKKKGEKGTISPYFLILLVAMGDNLSLFCSVKNIKRNQMEFLGRFCFLDVDIALSSFWPFLFHSWKLHMMTGTGAATLHH